MKDPKVHEPIRARRDSGAELFSSPERLHQQVRPRLVVLQEHPLSGAATRVSVRQVVP